MQSAQTTHLVLSDGPGTFYVMPDGSIKVMGGYPNVGTTFSPGTATYDQVIKNLASVGANKVKLDAYLGAQKVLNSLNSPALRSTSGPLATMDDIGDGEVALGWGDWVQENKGMVAGVGLATAVAIGLGVLLFWPDE